MTKIFLVGANKEIDTAKQVVKENQILIGYGAYMAEFRYVVYKVEYIKSKWGNFYQYHLINLETKATSVNDIIRPLSQKFGIGTYFDDINPQFMDSIEVAILLQEAEQIAGQQAEEKEKKRIEAEEVKEIGRKRLTEIIPHDAQAIIIACEKEDESNPYEDYSSSRTIRTIILGFSTHKKDIFSEMRKYASNFEGTTYLAEHNPDYEHREKYSMGKGYYLGKSYYSGWIIKKAPIYNRQNTIEEFALVAGKDENIHIKKKDNTPPSDTSYPTNAGCCKMMEYSEKSIAVYGETKAIKEELKAMGGRFNSRLTINGERISGWIFPRSKEQRLAHYFGLN